MFNQKKRVTIEFDAAPKDFETSILDAKDALIKTKEAKIGEGAFRIGDVRIEIETLSGGK